MGISVQVNKKTDKRGTWEYHTVGGWYLATSPEHYRTHIKSTNNERFTDTIHFNYRKITRPTIKHADKLMAAIEYCSKAIKDFSNGNGSKEMNQLIQIIERAIQHKTYISTTPTTTMCDPESSRVPLYTNKNNTRQTISMTQPNPQLPILSTSSVSRVELSTNSKRKHRRKEHKATFNTIARVHNTRSRTQTAETPQVSRTRAHTQ